MKKRIPEIVSGLLVLLFVYAATSKLFGFEQFRMQLGSSPLLGPYAAWIAWPVPVVELVIAGMLTVKATHLYGLYASFVLLSAFTIYISAMLLTQSHLPCSCGGVIARLGWPQHLVFNVFFMALCGWDIVTERINERNTVTLSRAGS